MKARTRFEKEAVKLYATLPSVPPKRILDWAKKNVVNHYAYKLKHGKAVCLDCGCGFDYDKADGTTRCPHCHAKVEVETTTKRTYEDKSYFSYVTTVQGVQLVRSFRLDATFRKGKEAEYELYEICSHFINDNGKVAMISVPKTMGCYVDSFALYSGELSLHQDSYAYRYVASCNIAPYRCVTPAIRQRGYKPGVNIHDVTLLFQMILTDSKYETMLKNDDIDLLNHFLAHGRHSIGDYWSEYKVAHRHHYKITDANMWCDTVDALRRCHCDTHNPHYICPEDLHAAHDHWAGRVQQIYRKEQEIREKEAREKQRELAKAAQSHFEEIKSKYFGLTISENSINISVVDRVDDFYQLGQDMHICLGQMRYYEKDSSLILLAKVDNKIQEVIELSLDNFKVLQSRSYCNKPSEYHDQIVSLMERNVGQVARLKSA